MRWLKPKDLGKILKLPPSVVTKYAKELETTGIYQFEKTAFGSYLFQEHEIEFIKEYQEIKYFFGRKKNALEMMKVQWEERLKEEEENPIWIHFLSNIKCVH